ncbi:O-antigen ligase family protein [Salinimicrobium oceani]|nr:O-antigen ligase family protein [Salinimicrobium oceani]
MLLLHFLIGFSIFIYRPLGKLYVLGALAYFLFIVLQNKNKNNEALMGAAYIAGAEVFFRMIEAAPFYETGKYSVILFLIIGMFFKGTSSRTMPYWAYLLILVPGIVVAASTWGYEYDFRKQVAFNLSGPVALGVSAVYCYYKKIEKEDYQKVLLMLLMPLLSQMFYLYLYTPNMRDVAVNLQANYAATAGYGPNQISTVFGLGMFILASRFFTIRNNFINSIDLVLLVMISYRALMTFSRGGVLAGIICIGAFLFVFYSKKQFRDRGGIKRKILLFGAAGIFIWGFSLFQSGGMLDNRYTNRDAAGRLKDDITTGRVELVETELEGFYYNPVLGIGVGKGKEMRSQETGMETASHNEISRLLSEHGMLGVVAVVILIFVPVIFWTKFKNNYYFLAFLAFWFLTINHSAMRIALPAFVYGLALLYIVDDKKRPRNKKNLEAKTAVTAIE